MVTKPVFEKTELCKELTIKVILYPFRGKGKQSATFRSHPFPRPRLEPLPNSCSQACAPPIHLASPLPVRPISKSLTMCQCSKLTPPEQCQHNGLLCTNALSSSFVVRGRTTLPNVATVSTVKKKRILLFDSPLFRPPPTSATTPVVAVPY